jgi:hypothetical protein
MSDLQEHPDELYFKELRQGWHAFRNLARAGLSVLGRKIKQYWVLLLLLALVLSARAAYRFSMQQPVLRASASYVYTDLHPKVYGEMIDKLQEALQQNSYATISRELKMPVGQLKTVKDVYAQNIFGSKLSEDIKGDDHVPFYVIVVAGRNTIFDTLQQKIEDYFNDNMLAKQRMEKKKDLMAEKIEYAKRQLVLLDSLKIAYNHNLRSSNTRAYPVDQVFNPVDIYNKSIEINNSLAEMETELPEIKAVRLLNGFTVPDHPAKVPLAVFMTRALLYFLLIGLGFVFLQLIFKK